MAARRLPSVVVVMGVAGAGKSTVGLALAQRLGWPFADGDSFHPPANLAKLRGGTALGDADRWEWLHALAGWVDAVRASGRHGVLACSALRRAYRAVLVGGRPDVRLVYLKGDRELIAARIAARRGHLMPASLLESQFQALEEPGEDEHPIVVPVTAPPAELVASIERALGSGG